MADIISLTNRALLGIGAKAQISSLSEGSTESDAVSILFQPTFEQLGRAANWNCLRKQNELTLLKAAVGTPENPLGTTLPLPSQPWLYEYEYPSDCLKLRQLLPTFTTSDGIGFPFVSAGTYWPTQGGQIPFIVNYDADSYGNPIIGILTNLSAAQAIYTGNQPNPQSWDSQFQAAFVASLAAFLVPALSLNLPLMNTMIGMAEKAIATARSADGNEGTISQNREASWIVARGAGYETQYMNSYNYGYDDIAWPSWGN